MFPATTISTTTTTTTTTCIAIGSIQLVPTKYENCDICFGKFLDAASVIVI